MNGELWVACYLNRTERALLLAESQDVNQEKAFMSPLYWAVQHSNFPLIQKLVSLGARDNLALLLALRIGESKIIHFLLDHGMMFYTDYSHVVPDVRAKMESIELFRCYAVLQRPDLVVEQLRAGRSAPFQHWLSVFNAEAFTLFCSYLVLAQKIEASCFAAFFFGESDAPLRRYTWTGSPVSELLVRYLVLPKAGRRALRDIRAYLE